MIRFFNIFFITLFIVPFIAASNITYAETLASAVCGDAATRSLRFEEQDSYQKCLEVINDPAAAAEACDKLIAFPLYCEGGEAEIGFGTVANNTLRFTVEFKFKRPGKKIGLYLAEGTARSSLSSETKVTDLKCTNTETGSVCRSNLNIRKFCAVNNKVDLDSAVQSVHIRKGNKEICLGKFSNDETLITRPQRTERQFCKFTPSSGNEGISGEGFFDPAGYGTQGETQFYMAMEGLPTGKEIKGCTPLGSKYKEVLSFQSYGPESTDSVIYRNASESEQQKIAAEPLEYSYDLYRALQAQASSLLTYSRSLAQINRQVSSEAAVTEARESNKRFKKLKRERKKKKRGAKKKAKRRTRFLSASSTRDLPEPQSAIAWLAFDPVGGGDVVLANNCRKKTVTRKSYGTIQCGVPSDENRSCITLSDSSQPSHLAQACFEARQGYNLFTVRLEGVPTGSYYVCNSTDQVTAATINVVNDDLGTFGELIVVDNAVTAETIPGVNFGIASNTFKDLKVVPNADCSGNSIVQGSF